MTGRKPPKLPEKSGIGVATLDSPRITQAARRETAERAILEAAKAIVAERGLEDLTLNEAGEAAGYSRALPAHYFGTRSAMIAALADHIMADYSVRARAAFLPGGGLDRLCERIAFYIDDSCGDPQTLRAFLVILGAGLTRPELTPIVARLNGEAVEGLAGLIRDARDRGEIRADARPRAEASLLLASIRGVLFQWLINPDHVSLPRVRDSLVESVRRSLAP